MKPTNKPVSERTNMKVTMTSVMCGPEGNAFPGTVLDIPKDRMMTLEDGKQVPMADYMVNNKFARQFDQQKDSKARQFGLLKAAER